MFRDSDLRTYLERAPFMVRQGIEWREEGWEKYQDDPQVHEDLSLLLGLRAMGVGA